MFGNCNRMHMDNVTFIGAPQPVQIVEKEVAKPVKIKVFVKTTEGYNIPILFGFSGNEVRISDGMELTITLRSFMLFEQQRVEVSLGRR